MGPREVVTQAGRASAAVEALRRQTGAGVSEAVNQLIRGGLTRKPPSQPYRHRTRDLGLTVDVTNIGDLLDLLDSA